MTRRLLPRAGLRADALHVLTDSANSTSEAHLAFLEFSARGQDQIASLIARDGGEKLVRAVAGMHSSQRVVQAAPAFPFGSMEIAAWAEGPPSLAFGPRFSPFDAGRRFSPRVPRGPFTFISRAKGNTPSNGAPSEVLAEYDVPEDAWYFEAAGSDYLPFAVLLEAALQPCGWIVAASGAALEFPHDVLFRNLGGDASLVGPIPRTIGLLRTRAALTGSFAAAGVRIFQFRFEVTGGGESESLLYGGTTEFGLFTEEAMANQRGLPPQAQQPSGGIFRPISPKGKRRPAPQWRMFDYVRVSGVVGETVVVKSVKEVRADDWYFSAHFFEDPVCPGSLGLEGALQGLEFALRDIYRLPQACFRMPAQQHRWVYRGQIVPANRRTETTVHFEAPATVDQPSLVSASATLSVDGLPIYQFHNFAVEFVRAVVN